MDKSKNIKAGQAATQRHSVSGRPSKYSLRVTREICAAISDGTPFSYAAAIGGISYETFCQWRKKYPEFSDAIEAAKARGIRARLQLIVKAAESGDVAAARWWLEHVGPDVPAFLPEAIADWFSQAGSIGADLPGIQAMLFKKADESADSAHGIPLSPGCGYRDFVSAANRQDVFVSTSGKIAECLNLTINKWRR